MKTFRSAATVPRKPKNWRKNEGTAKPKRGLLRKPGKPLKLPCANNGVHNRSAAVSPAKENRRRVTNGFTNIFIATKTTAERYMKIFAVVGSEKNATVKVQTEAI
jgi:hypothetical protein